MSFTIPIVGVSETIAGAALSGASAPAPEISQNVDFSETIKNGIAGLEVKIDQANELVRDFALDDAVPIHEVTIALEEARLGVELAMQMRNGAVDAYKELMNMQI